MYTPEQVQKFAKRMKRAAATVTAMPTNEASMNLGTNHLYNPPANRAALSGTIDAPWGESPPSGEFPTEQGTAALREAYEGRHALLERVFDSFPAASSAEKAELSENFDHAAAGNYEAHSALLHRQKTAARMETLSEKVLRITGRL